jgi:hypothetical protein
MTLLFANGARPVVDLDLPATEPPATVILRNNTNAKTLALLLPEDWDGRDVTLDFTRQTITNAATGADLSSLLDPTNRGLWIPNPMINGVNDFEIEATKPGLLVAKDDFNQASGNITGKALETGGLWEGDGDADDLQRAAPGVLLRSPAAVDSVGIGRRITAATPEPEAVRVRIDMPQFSAGGGGPWTSKVGVFARRQPAGERVRLAAQLFQNGGVSRWQLQFVQNIGAAAAGTIAEAILTAGEISQLPKGITIAMEIVGNGAKMWAGPKGALPAYTNPTLSATHKWLNGEELAVKKGKLGLEEEWLAGSTLKEYDKFRAYDLAAKAPYVVAATVRWDRGYF